MTSSESSHRELSSDMWVRYHSFFGEIMIFRIKYPCRGFQLDQVHMRPLDLIIHLVQTHENLRCKSSKLQDHVNHFQSVTHDVIISLPGLEPDPNIHFKRCIAPQHNTGIECWGGRLAPFCSFCPGPFCSLIETAPLYQLGQATNYQRGPTMHQIV